VVAVAGSVVLAVAAYGLVEQPVRRYPLKWWWETALAVLALAGLWLGIDTLHHQLRGKLFVGSDPSPVPAHEKINNFNPMIRGTGITPDCTVPVGKPYGLSTRPNYDICQKPGRPGAGEIFLIGDSHAQHLVPMLDLVTSRTGQRLTFAAMGGCVPDPMVQINWGMKDYGPCQDFVRGEMDRAVERLRPGDIVMLSSWLNYYLSDTDARGQSNGAVMESGGRRLTAAQAREMHATSMRRFAKRLAARDIQLVLFVDTPILAREMMFCPRDFTRTCSPEAEQTAQMQQRLRDTLMAAASDLPNVHVFDSTPTFLDAKGRVTYRKPDGTPLFADSNHLSITGSRSLAEPFERFLVQSGLIQAPSR
jgi:hypothetical protein